MANTISIEGNLGKDPELKVSQAGKAILNFSIGDTPRRKTDNGWEDAGETTWWNVTCWETQAETLANVLKKGIRVMVTGTAGVRTYDKNDGTKGWSAEIKPRTVAIIPKATSSGPQQVRQQVAADPWATGPTSDTPPF